MVDFNSMFPSEHLKAADLQGRDVTVTISHWEMKEVGGDMKPVLYFQGKEKGLVLNKTNGNTIASIHGMDTDFWINKQITLTPSQTDFQGKTVPCIRVRLQTPAMQPAQPEPAPTGGGAIDDEIPFVAEWRG